MGNLRYNWWLPVSAAAYFCLQSTVSVSYLAGILIAVGLLALGVSRIGSIWQWVRERKGRLICFSMLTAAGICWAGQEKFASIHPGTGNLGIFLALTAFVAVFVFVLWFWHWLGGLLWESGAFRNLHRAETMCYVLLLLATAVAAGALFARTDASYDTEYEYDIVYTSDSPVLVKENAYLNLTQKENDLRQPLFAVFTAPMLGAAYFLGKLLGGPAVQAALMNAVQIGMLLSAHLLLAHAMGLPPGKRVCFMLLAACTYTQMLFSWMMEQYVPAYFWLMLCICLYCQKGTLDRRALWGAGGTLLTSLILLPCLTEKPPFREKRMWIREMALAIAEFLGVMLVFCRLDVLVTVISKVMQLSAFAGGSVSFREKLCQYTVFLRSCFLAPEAGISEAIPEHISWQLAPAEGPNWCGVLIFSLCLFSAWWNRDKKSSRLAAAWCGFSVAMLLLLGWGTKENGLILYALYFGWAYFVLLFQFGEKVQEKLGIRWLLPAASILGAVIMLAGNIPAMGELIQFVTTWFSVS